MSNLFARLTPAERRVLMRLIRGGTNRRIARDLFVSINTVKSHLQAIYRKLGAKNKTTAVVMAWTGIVPPWDAEIVARFEIVESVDTGPEKE